MKRTSTTWPLTGAFCNCLKLCRRFLLSSGGLHSFSSDPLVAFVLQKDNMGSEHDTFLALRYVASVGQSVAIN